ncbi:MAG: hypothetical protein ACT4PI_13015 [Actinomycetota bacterium]
MPRMAAVVVDGWYRVGQLVVCGTCQRLHGPWREVRDPQVRVQYCGCGRDAIPFPHEDQGGLWTRFDYPQVAELCRCCGLEVLASGSKWSVWFCDHCKDWVRELNETAGTCVIPIGRHSLMNGVALRADRAAEPGAIEHFAIAVQSLTRSQTWTADWVREVVRQNLAAVGTDPGVDVLLPGYLELTDLHLLRKPAAVRRMFAAAGVQMLTAASPS